MREIKFIKGINGLTKIMVDGRELTTSLDLNALRTFRLAKAKMAPVVLVQAANAVKHKLTNDVVSLTPAETNHIMAFVNEELGL